MDKVFHSGNIVNKITYGFVRNRIESVVSDRPANKSSTDKATHRILLHQCTNYISTEEAHVFE